MSVKVSFNEQSISRTESKIKDAFAKVIKNKKMMEEIGDVVITDVKFQTRSGKSIVTGARLKPLGAAWIKRRDTLSEVNETSDVYAQKRSNLSFTGQLLESMSFKFIKDGVIQIFFKGNHKPYRSRGRDGKTNATGKEITNDKLAEFVQRLRPFVGVRALTRNKIKKIVLAYIRRSREALNYIKGS